jgi:hypothetical protein
MRRAKDATAISAESTYADRLARHLSREAQLSRGVQVDSDRDEGNIPPGPGGEACDESTVREV